MWLISFYLDLFPNHHQHTLFKSMLSGLRKRFPDTLSPLHILEFPLLLHDAFVVRHMRCLA